MLAVIGRRFLFFNRLGSRCILIHSKDATAAGVGAEPVRPGRSSGGVRKTCTAESATRS